VVAFLPGIFVIRRSELPFVITVAPGVASFHSSRLLFGPFWTERNPKTRTLNILKGRGRASPAVPMPPKYLGRAIGTASAACLPPSSRPRMGGAGSRPWPLLEGEDRPMLRSFLP
jgi:hypothetical protein